MPKNPRRARSQLCDSRFGTSTSTCSQALRKRNKLVAVCDAGAIEGLDAVIAKVWRGVPLGMHRMSPECLDFDRSSLSIAVTILLREEPDEEEDEEEDDRKEEDDDENDEGDGYSE
jgi:hypothetical protein